MKHRILSALILTCLTFFIAPLRVFASEYFDTSYYVTYDVTESGQTNATIDVTLTNKTSDYYASSYKIKVGFQDIETVTAEDPGGELTPKVSKVADGNVIEAAFNEYVVGEGKSLTYSISFSTQSVATKNGSIWEINIPGINDPTAFDTFTVEVNVPESFGQPRYIKPSHGSPDTIFTKEELQSSGISLAYGSEQVYLFDLTYHLENTNLFPVNTEIALPPTTNYQEVYIDSIEPKPDNVILDKDGNWLAQFSLNPTERQDVRVKGNAVVSLTPKKESLTEDQRRAYLLPDTYWEVNDPTIQELAQELKTPRAIYNYVVSELSYDFSRLEENKPRLGGLGVLNSKDSAVCLEFTDLFITLARAAGIPAREVDGYAHTENERQRPLSLVQDILHAWPEYYDAEKQTWIMVDPTWGNTTGGVDYFDTFDFDHFTLAIKGHDSEYPIPAGGYKYKGSETVKDISIDFNPHFQTQKANVAFQIESEDSYLSGLPMYTNLIVTNVGPVLNPVSDITVTSDSLTPNDQRITLTQIPPFGHATYPVRFDKQPLLTNNEFGYTILVAGESISEKLTVKPFFHSWYGYIGGGILFGILTTVIFIITRKTRRI